MYLHHMLSLAASIKYEKTPFLYPAYALEPISVVGSQSQAPLSLPSFWIHEWCGTSASYLGR